MKRNPFIDDYTAAKEKDYSPLIKDLIAAINANDDAAIKDLAIAVKAVAEREPQVIKQDNTDVLNALGGMIEQLKQMCQSSMQNNMAMASAIRDIEMPEVSVNPVIESAKKEQIAYKFDIKRNTANLITEVVATPIGGTR